VKADDVIERRLAELLTTGEQVLGTRSSPPPGVMASDFVDTELMAQWATSSQSLLARVFGPDSDHYRNFTAAVAKRSNYSSAKRAQGVLRAAEDDFRAGALFEVRNLVEAELFDDFLDQAEVLLEAGYYQPAAVVAGAVLEDGLRRLCESNGLTLDDRLKLDAMNSMLAKADVYSKLVQKRITVLADLRNKAAHGKWKEFEKEDVDDMVAQVRRFMTDQFA